MIKDHPHFKVINEAYPHIGKRMDLFWGYPEFNFYMNQLLYENKMGQRPDSQEERRGKGGAMPGQRAGFPEDHLKILLSLAARHVREYPETTVKKEDLWFQKNPKR